MQRGSQPPAESGYELAPRPVTPEREGRILPLIAISGASGKTSTGWLLVQMLEAAGYEVGAWLSDGVYVDRELRRDELHAWELAIMATRARELDLLIQEIPSVLAQNLAPDTLWVGVLTSICGTDDHCQRDTATLRHRDAVAAVTRAIHPDGTLIANADDLLIVDAAGRSGRNLLMYALNGANPVLKKHLCEGGDAVWIQNGWVKAQRSGSNFRVVKVADLPSTLNGHLIYQVQNTLAAIATLLACANSPEVAASTVRASFGSYCYLAREGTQIREHDQRTTIVDTPRSIQAIKQIVRGVRALGPRRVVQRLGLLRGLTDDEAAEASRVLGSLGGIAILCGEDNDDPRIQMIKAGLMESSNPPAIVMRNRGDASLKHVESLLENGDIAIVLDSM